jgi:Family of unknown function (DUF6348)
MCSWFKRSERPPHPSPANPGRGALVKAAFATGDRSWSDRAELVSLLADVLRSRGHALTVKRNQVSLPNGVALVPQVVRAVALQTKGLQTTSTIQISHPSLVPEGLFEYQHAMGDTLDEAFRKGFDGFAEGDLPVFLDALEANPRECTFLNFILPAGVVEGERIRRVAVLGPAARYGINLAAEDEEHPFCACCLLTRNLQAFKSIIEATHPYGIRFYVMRDNSGNVIADCRVNGEDWPTGVEALVNYGRTWPGDGFEYRKQYVFIHTVPVESAGE